MILDEKAFLAFLDADGFSYRRIEHPAVFTCAEAELHRPDSPATSTKNLFLCDKKGRRFFLAVTSCEKNVKLDRLSAQMGVPHLRFASEENLQRLLGVGRGAVTMMGLVNDASHQVELWIDSGIWHSDYFLSHPLVNTATLVLAKGELERFFRRTGHAVHLFDQQAAPSDTAGSA
jgi:Ala-tRNA(Pro) deacylase